MKKLSIVLISVQNYLNNKKMIENKFETFGYVAEYENKYLGVINENYLPKKIDFVELEKSFILCKENVESTIDILNEIYIDNIIYIKEDKLYKDMVEKCSLKKIKITTTIKKEIIND